MNNTQHKRSVSGFNPPEKSAEVDDQFRSDLRRVKLQLLVEANELCQRAFIIAHNEKDKQYEIERMKLFEDAMDDLTSLRTIFGSYKSDLSLFALRQAYDVVSGNMELRDMAFYDVSYGTLVNEMHDVSWHH